MNKHNRSFSDYKNGIHKLAAAQSIVILIGCCCCGRRLVSNNFVNPDVMIVYDPEDSEDLGDAYCGPCFRMTYDYHSH